MMNFEKITQSPRELAIYTVKLVEKLDRKHFNEPLWALVHFHENLLNLTAESEAESE